MSKQALVETVKKTYDAWNAGHHQEVVAAFDGGLTWVVPGRSERSGKADTEEAVISVLEALGRADYEVSPRHYIADEERVIALVQAKINGVQHGAVDVWTFEAGRLAKYQHASTDTTLLDRALGGR